MSASWAEYLVEAQELRAASIRNCVVCSMPIPRHRLDTDRTYAARDVCSSECMRKVKGTPAERGKLGNMARRAGEAA